MTTSGLEPIVHYFQPTGHAAFTVVCMGTPGYDDHGDFEVSVRREIGGVHVQLMSTSLDAAALDVIAGTLIRAETSAAELNGSTELNQRRSPRAAT